MFPIRNPQKRSNVPVSRKQNVLGLTIIIFSKRHNDHRCQQYKFRFSITIKFRTTYANGKECRVVSRKGMLAASLISKLLFSFLISIK